MLVIAVLVVSAVMIVCLETGDFEVNCLEFFVAFGGKTVFVIGAIVGSIFCSVNS